MKKMVLLGLAVAISTALAIQVTHALSGSSNGTLRNAPSEPGPDPHLTVAPDSSVVTHSPVVVDGEQWSVTTFRNVLDEFCIGQKVPEEGEGVSCYDDPGKLPPNVPVTFSVGSRQRPGGDLTRWHNIWISGLAAPNVASLTVTRTDCSRDVVAMDSEGVFLYVLGAAEIAKNLWPYQIEARNAAGTIVWTHLIDLHPPDTEEAKSAEVHAPSPPADCG